MRVRILLLYVIVWSCLGFSTDSYVWNRIGFDIHESDIRSILIDREISSNIYVGTSKALYRSLDNGKSFQSLLTPSGKMNGVNDVFISLNQPKVIYAAADSGLYESKNDGHSWDRIYYSSSKGAKRCLSVIRYNHTIYLGTQKGLFHKKVNESSWHKSKGNFNDKPVYQLDQDERFLYGATGQTVYSLNKRTHDIKKIFSIGIGGETGNDIVVGQDSKPGEARYIKFIEISSLPEHQLSVATSKGIYISSNHGKDWRRLSTNNLAVEELTSLTILENNTTNKEGCLEDSVACLQIIAGSNKGVFFLKNERWIPLYKGMETNKVSYLTKNSRGTVYAATTRGVYFLPTEEALPYSYESTNHIKKLSKSQPSHGDWYKFDYEPSITEVHQLAIDYAEVNREKIQNWRVLARRKAILPDLSVGLDRNASDLFHWNTGANPDELQKGRDYVDWDVSLSWDLADLIWSTAQTTIDSRSKLMVELREDILDEVTRIYFERKRVQVEMKSEDFSGEQLKIDKEMRIAELTALIDALTGGEFSKRIVK